ncbi:MAG: hypothetical protein GTO40_10585 [Deltaproteobacteria bacterium]|nr:hypothetical protein [Deltaproteobacteria bacterium]
MAKIRHIAIMTKEPPQLAEFYKTTFGMKEVPRNAPNPESRAIYLSDGYINLAILYAGNNREGIHHFGFQVDSVEETFRTAKGAGARDEIEEKPRDGRFAEVAIKDLTGTKVDLSKAGWRT